MFARALLIALIAAAAAVSFRAETATAPPPSAELRLARLQLRLAEVGLERVQKANRRVASAVPASVLAEYAEDLAVAQARLRAAEESPAAPLAAWLRAAEAAARAAETQWKNAMAVNARLAGTVDELDVERLRLRAELASLRLEQGREAGSADERLQWQLALLFDDVQRLKQQARHPAPSSGVLPLWWFY